MKTNAAAQPDDSFHAFGEVPFSFEELFFSRTNDKGRILAGNSVFQRVSLYSWDELIDQPHSIIRHQDMPRAVFWLLWDAIKRGEPIGAYVKNRAKDGRYYWVYAIVTPIEGGYLSVRLKPSSTLFAVVEREYASLLAVETAERMKPADSAALFLKRLQELGFADYTAFMAATLGHEIAARDAQLRRPPDATATCFEALAKASQTLLTQAGLAFEAHAVNAYVPINLRVQAAQLGQEAATIGVISSNYNVLSEEIRGMMTEFLASAAQVAQAVNSGLFLVCTAKMQKEMQSAFAEEGGDAGISQGEEGALLDRQRKAYETNALDGLHTVAGQAERFQQSCMEMKRLAAGLEVTRVMGKIENARLRVTTEGLNDLVNSLEDFQGTLSDSLKEIDHMNRSILRNIQELIGRAEGR